MIKILFVRYFVFKSINKTKMKTYKNCVNNKYIPYI